MHSSHQATILVVFWWLNDFYHTRMDPGFFLGAGAPVRNGVTDW